MSDGPIQVVMNITEKELEAIERTPNLATQIQDFMKNGNRVTYEADNPGDTPVARTTQEKLDNLTKKINDALIKPGADGSRVNKDGNIQLSVKFEAGASGRGSEPETLKSSEEALEKGQKYAQTMNLNDLNTKLNPKISMETAPSVSNAVKIGM